jgi:hypothetical protein
VLLLLADVFLEARTAGALFCGLAAGCCCLSWKTSRANKAQRLEAAAWVAHAALEVAVDFGLGNSFLAGLPLNLGKILTTTNWSDQNTWENKIQDARHF